MNVLRGLVVTWLVLIVCAMTFVPAAAAPEGQLTWAVHVSLAPTWFDPLRPPGSSRRTWSSTPCTTAW